MFLSHLFAPRAVEQGIKEEFYKLRTCTCGASNLRPNSFERNICKFSRTCLPLSPLLPELGQICSTISHSSVAALLIKHNVMGVQVRKRGADTA
jgi:hypothetical protein